MKLGKCVLTLAINKASKAAPQSMYTIKENKNKKPLEIKIKMWYLQEVLQNIFFCFQNMQQLIIKELGFSKISETSRL